MRLRSTLLGTQRRMPTVEPPFSTLEYRSMTYSNAVRDDTQQLRDIQDLIAKLEDVNKKLAQPKRAMSMTTAQTTDADPADTASI